MSDIDWLSYGFVLASSHRKHLVWILRGGPSTPSSLAKKAGLPVSHVSKALKELELNNLVICLTPDLRKGRVYALTQSGRKIADRIESP
jgi:DNA-binding MarR family transcriptional regulator